MLFHNILLVDDLVLISVGKSGIRIQFTEEHKKNLSKSLKGRIVSKETREKLSKSLKGHPTSQETRKKISESHKGKKLSIETRNKMSQVRRGTSIIDEYGEDIFSFEGENGNNLYI